MIYLVAGMLLCCNLAGLEGCPSPAKAMASPDTIDTATELRRIADILRETTLHDPNVMCIAVWSQRRLA